MKTASLIFLLFTISIFNLAEAQKHIPTNFIDMFDIVGRWQRDTKAVGNGLKQNFQFFKNGFFTLYLGDGRDDARRVISLKGKYRLKKDTIFFTILSQTKIVGGKIMVDPDAYGLAFNIFDIDSGKVEEIQLKNPVEQAPCYITIINNSCIKLDNEVYYKISNNPNRYNE